MTLLERLEKAAGPDRWLDAAIAEKYWQENPYWYPCGQRDLRNGIPHYTDSIDAALTLETDEWKMRVLEQMDAGEWLCVFINETADTAISARHKLKTLAVCIAAIKARVT